MREELTGIDALEAVFDAYGFPPEMLADYDQMECLSSRRGRETFLMRRRADGALAVAKCYDRAVFPLGSDDALPDTAGCPGVPKVLGRYENERYLCVVREYVEGVSLAEYVRDRELSQAEIVEICGKLCGILDNFDTARTFKPEAESDTLFFGTKGYAAPEQYGFAQTDARTDEYSLGVLLRFLLTGSVRKSPHVRLYRPLEKIIDRCTAFAPEKRYPDMKSVARALRAANPRARFLRIGGAAGGGGR